MMHSIKAFLLNQIYITQKLMVYVGPWYEMYNLGNSYKINIVWNHGGSFNLSKKVWQ